MRCIGRLCRNKTCQPILGLDTFSLLIRVLTDLQRPVAANSTRQNHQSMSHCEDNAGNHEPDAEGKFWGHLSRGCSGYIVAVKRDCQSCPDQRRVDGPQPYLGFAAKGLPGGENTRKE